MSKAHALDGTMAAPRRFVPERDGWWDGYAYEIDPSFARLAADVARHRARRPPRPDHRLTAASMNRERTVEIAS